MPTDHLEDDCGRHGLAARVGFGEPPALLVVDFVRATTAKW